MKTVSHRSNPMFKSTNSLLATLKEEFAKLEKIADDAILSCMDTRLAVEKAAREGEAKLLNLHIARLEARLEAIEKDLSHPFYPNGSLPKSGIQLCACTPTDQEHCTPCSLSKG
jgi:hypothetical protein